MPKVQPIEVENGGGRRARSHRVSSSLSEINVVPLVDVMLVLLIIFMVTAPMMQRGIDVNLPAARRAQPLTQAQPTYVSVPSSFPRDHVVRLNDEPIRVEILAERIRQAMLTRSDKQVYLRSDQSLSVQNLLDVMDKLKEGGVEKVGIVAKLPGEQ